MSIYKRPTGRITQQRGFPMSLIPTSYNKTPSVIIKTNLRLTDCNIPEISLWRKCGQSRGAAYGKPHGKQYAYDAPVKKYIVLGAKQEKTA